MEKHFYKLQMLNSLHTTDDKVGDIYKDHLSVLKFYCSNNVVE